MSGVLVSRWRMCEEIRGGLEDSKTGLARPFPIGPSQSMQASLETMELGWFLYIYIIH